MDLDNRVATEGENGIRGISGHGKIQLKIDGEKNEKKTQITFFGLQINKLAWCSQIVISEQQLGNY